MTATNLGITTSELAAALLRIRAPFPWLVAASNFALGRRIARDAREQEELQERAKLTLGIRRWSPRTRDNIEDGGR